MKSLLSLAVTLTALLAGIANAQINSWSTNSGGKWEAAVNWSLGVPPAGTQSVFITNAFTKTVTIDATTVLSNAINSCMTVSNLTVLPVPAFGNTLAITNAGLGTPLRVRKALTTSILTSLIITNSALVVDALGSFSVGGDVFFRSGSIISTNAQTVIGCSGAGGQISMFGGSWTGLSVTVSLCAGPPAALNISGGTNSMFDWRVAFDPNSTGSVWITGAPLVEITRDAYVGFQGAGRLTISNGTVNVNRMTLGLEPGASGTLTVAGGTFTANQLIATNLGSNIQFPGGTVTIKSSQVASAFLIPVGNDGRTAVLNLNTGTNRLDYGFSAGASVGSTGIVWLTSGHLAMTNGLFGTRIGNSGVGQMNVSNGTCEVARMIIGYNTGARGTLTIAGGTSVIASNLVVGLAANTTGIVWVTGGQLLSTNSIGGNDTIIASNGTGQATISNGFVRTYTQIIGAGSAGTLTMAGGTNHVGGDLILGQRVGATGTVWLTGGQLEVNDGADPLVILGNAGVGRMTVSNGTWLSRYVDVGGTVGGSGTLTIAGGTNIVNALLGLGMSSGATGVVWMTGGELTTTNSSARVGHVSVAQMTVSNGTWRARNVDVGAFSGGRGTLTLAGGNNQFASLTAGMFPGATGTVVVTGIQLILTNAPTTIGSNGVGQLTITNATVQTSTLVIGHGFGSAGTVTLNGGTLITDKLVLTNLNSRLAFNSGTLETKSTVATNLDGIAIGNNTNAATLRLVGGTHSCFDDGAGNLVVFSNAVLTGSGAISLSFVHNFGVIAPGDSIGRLDINGSLRLTNSSEVRFELGGYTSGTTHDLITVTNTTTLRGKLSVSFVNDFASTVTNGARFTVFVGHAPIAGTFANVASGGLLATTDGFANFIVTYSGTNIVLSSLGILDSDVDGMPNWWEQKYFGSLTGAAPGLDDDGDGLTNLQEFQSGTDPTNSASVFRITAITKVSTNILIEWLTGPGKINALERTAGVAGSYSNNFITIFTATNTTAGTTNYLDLGAATGPPAFYYRVRLVP